MKKIICLGFCPLLTLLLLVASCQTKKQEKGVADGHGDQKEVLHTAKNSLDWGGTYFAVLPCPSCDGINTMISLGGDNTMEISEEFIGTQNEPVQIRGSFTWDDDGQRIKMKDRNFFVSENRLLVLDEKTGEIPTDKSKVHELAKIEFDQDAQASQGYTRQSFKGSDGTHYTVAFYTKTNVPIVIIETEGMQRILSQTKAWAKGADYIGANIGLTVSGDNGSLVLNGKTVNLTAIN